MIKHVELVDLIFSGLAERPVWQQFLRRLAERLSGSASALIIASSGHTFDEGAVLSPIGTHEQFVDLIGAAFLDEIPFDQPRMLTGEGSQYPAWNGSAILRLRLDQQRSMWLITCPRSEDGKLAADWQNVLEELQPYLARIMLVYLVLVDSERRRLIAEYVLESSGAGVILVDENGTVIHANAAAQTILADTQLLSMKEGRIFANRQGDHKILMEHIRTKASEQSAAGRLDCYSTIALSRNDHTLPLTAIIRPGPPFAPISAPLRRTAVIVLRDPARRTSLVAADIERLFNLSPAESQLARLLAEGMSTGGAAVRLGVSRHTVRSQLQSIFVKTGTNRQGELVRMLLTSAATLARGEERAETGHQANPQP